jgi:hypothetical protein
MPSVLKQRLEREAKYQGVSLNQLTNYLVTVQLDQLESVSLLESHLSRQTIPKLKKRVDQILATVPKRNVPEWDVVEDDT